MTRKVLPEGQLAPLSDLLGGTQRQSVYMGGLGILGVLLIPYIIAQAIALFFVDHQGYLNGGVFFFSMLLNLGRCPTCIKNATQTTPTPWNRPAALLGKLPRIRIPPGKNGTGRLSPARTFPVPFQPLY